MSQHDRLHRFIFEHHAVRGELVYLEKVYTTISEQRNYPPKVQTLLGEAMAATALLNATVKFKGALTLQAQTTGPVNLLIVQCNHKFEMRALAKWQPEADLTQDLLPDGHLIITMTPDNSTEQYQGVVPISTVSLNKNIETYFEQSEQLPTHLWLAANDELAVGFLIQKMPDLHQGEQQAGIEWDYWEHVKVLAATITDTELLTLAPEDILYRLFSEEDIRLFDPQDISFACQCNKQKMINALKVMGKTATYELLHTYHNVEVTCDFCNDTYAFNEKEIAEIFAAE